MANPTGQYTKVSTVPIQGGNGSLSGGTGTYNNGTFSCGQFDANDYPEVGKFYNITGTHGGQAYTFPGYTCTHSGATGDFQPPRATKKTTKKR